MLPMPHGAMLPAAPPLRTHEPEIPMLYYSQIKIKKIYLMWRAESRNGFRPLVLRRGDRLITRMRPL